MRESLFVPKTACSSCPYLRSTPAGVWDASEYQKLPAYDDPVNTGVFATVFRCHQQAVTRKPTVCRGWLSVHRDTVPVRIAQVFGSIRPEEVPTEPEPEYYGSGAEACAAGLAGVAKPSKDARKVIAKFMARRASRKKQEGK